MNPHTPRRAKFSLALAALLSVLCALPHTSAHAQIPAAAPAPPTIPDSPVGKVLTIVLKSIDSKDTSIPAAHFNEAFQKQVSPEQVKELCAQIIDQHGPCKLVKVTPGPTPEMLLADVSGSKTQEKFQIVLGLDKDGKMETLLFRPIPNANLPPFKNWAEVDAALTALTQAAGADPTASPTAAPAVVKVNFGAWELKPETDEAKKGSFTLAPVHTLNADSRLAIGSTFKLYILGALGEAVASGAAKWDEELPIKPEYKSLPSGTMQNEKDGATFPLSLYAEKMISISDNTATDHLLRRLTRSTVEDYMAKLHGKPTLNYPFISTRELFAIKLSPDTTLMARWNVAGEAGRRDMLVYDDIMKPTRPAGRSHTPGEVFNTNPDLRDAAAWIKPRNIDTIEWFASAEELARVMADLHRLEILPGNGQLGKSLRLNPGLPLDAATWPKIAFKGGSEPGVLNLTWMLTRNDERVFIVTFGWNSTKFPLDEGKLLEIAPRAIGLLKDHK